MSNPAAAKSAGIFGWSYNRANFKFDQGLRWQRFTTGRKMAMAQAGMHRQDITDLAGVSIGKLKVYGPIYGIVVTVCVTVFVEGRSGLKFPGPPVFISQIYLQCLGTGMCFVILAAWLLFHSALRAQIACIQLRTRKVRLPVPTQRQLDSARKLLSTWEEQGLYDMFRLPFVMPNGANSPENSDEEDEPTYKESYKGYVKGGVPGALSKVKAKAAKAAKNGELTFSARVPGFSDGNPSWYTKEHNDRKEHPKSSPSGFGVDGQPTPYEHFELLRSAQKDWWSAEAYMRICFLYGMMHLIMAFSYWITLHNICELGMVWCSNLGAAGLTAGVWIMFRIDVLPDHGGAFPVEIGGPFVTSIALGLMYAHTYTQTMIDIARGIAAFIILMHVALCFRMYMIAKPSMGRLHHHAKEGGGRLFNRSGSCDHPAWLPSAFQHVMYMVAPPKTREQLEQEQKDRDNNAVSEDPLAKVDMAPWQYTRFMIFMCGVAWTTQIAGHAIECVMGERMLVSNPGTAPWSRMGMWYGWEHGPTSSKHYAHVTPQRGHFAWQRGWGPQGQQELWASDMFGFAPEADAWWSEKEGPEPRTGAAGHGENTWAQGVIAYGQNEPKWGQHHAPHHDFEGSGGHRRLHELEVTEPRAVVPLPVAWPENVEPDFLTCAPKASGQKVLAVTASGLALVVDTDTSTIKTLVLEGLLDVGFARSASWGDSALIVVTASGGLARCTLDLAVGSAACTALATPALPAAAAVAAAEVDGAIRAAVATPTGFSLLELGVQGWQPVDSIKLPASASDVSVVSLSGGRFVAVDQHGAAHTWALRKDGTVAFEQPAMDVPMGGDRRQWQSACFLANGKIIRLASNWLRGKGGTLALKTELLV